MAASDEQPSAPPVLLRDEIQPDYAHDRCVCSNCGAHVPCAIGLATVAGQCSVCGGASVEPVPAEGVVVYRSS